MKRCNLYSALLFLGLFISFHMQSSAQTPVRIIIVSDNGQGTGGVGMDLSQEFEANHQDPNRSGPGCQEVIFIKGLPTKVKYNNFIHYTPNDLSALDSLKLEISIDHPDVSGGFYYQAKYSRQDLNTINATTLEVPFIFSTGLPYNYPANHEVSMWIEIHTKQIYYQHDPSHPFTRRVYGNLDVDICVYNSPSTGDVPKPVAGTRTFSPASEIKRSSVNPNPFDHYLELNIKTPEDQKPEVRLMDLSGKVWQLPMVAKFSGTDSWIISVSTESIPAGMYFLSAKSKTGTYLEKIIKN